MIGKVDLSIMESNVILSQNWTYSRLRNILCNSIAVLMPAGPTSPFLSCCVLLGYFSSHFYERTNKYTSKRKLRLEHFKLLP